MRWSEVGFCGGIRSVCEAENDGVPHLDRCLLSEELYRREDFVLKIRREELGGEGLPKSGMSRMMCGYWMAGIPYSTRRNIIDDRTRIFAAP